MHEHAGMGQGQWDMVVCDHSVMASFYSFNSSGWDCVYRSSCIIHCITTTIPYLHGWFSNVVVAQTFPKQNNMARATQALYVWAPVDVTNHRSSALYASWDGSGITPHHINCLHTNFWLGLTLLTGWW